MRYLTTQHQLAAIVGCDQSTISLRTKKDLADALVGKKLDVGHPSVQAFIAEYGKDPADVLDAYRQSALVDQPDRPSDTQLQLLQVGGTPENADDLKKMTVAEVAEKFGTRAEYLDYLVALSKIELIRQKQLANAETEGTLISRDLVKQHVTSLIDAAFRRLLTDTPKTIARRVYAMARSATNVEEAEATVKEIISSQLKPIKQSAARVLRQD